MLKVLDLFSGIGGFSLGLERTGGFETVTFCEIEEFPRRVLAKHWPKVPCYHDVRELTAERLSADGIAVDVICGGFPCQDISSAGKGAGIEGARSGLWKEYARLIGELRPRFAIVENVAALLGRGLGVVLGNLAEIGYDAEWHCIPASAAGAPHKRDRLWIVANACGGRRHQQDEGESQQPWRAKTIGPSEIVANSDMSRLEGWAETLRQEKGRIIDARYIGEDFSFNRRNGQWFVEPNVGRVAHGVPSRVDRLRGLGNAVVPQVVTLIGNAILQSMVPPCR